MSGPFSAAACRMLLVAGLLCYGVPRSTPAQDVAATAAPTGEPSALAAMAAMEQVLMRAIERSEKSVVSIARFNAEEVADRPPLRELRPGIPFGQFEPQRPDPTNPDFVPNDFATGVVIDKAGFVVTTRHAVDGPGEIWITTTGGKTARAEVVGADPRSDLAVLKAIDPPADAQFLPVTFGDASKLKKGQIVIVLGNPYAIARDGEASAGWGIIANLSRKAGPDTSTRDLRERKRTLHHFGTLIQTDAKLNLGTSGGALLNLKGEMIGLTTSQAAVAGFEQSAGYAIPVDDVFRRVVETLKKGEEVDYGLLGVQTSVRTAGERGLGLPGVRVDLVGTGTPADRAGISSGDVIVQVAGKPIRDVDGLMLQIGRQPAGNGTTVTVEREGRLFTIPVTLAKYEVSGTPTVTAPRLAWRGVRVDYPSAHRELDPQVKYGFRIVDPGVLVVDVRNGSPAWENGLRPGMIVTHVKNVSVESPAEFARQVRGLAGPVDLRIGALPGQPPVVRVPEDE